MDSRSCATAATPGDFGGALRSRHGLGDRPQKRLEAPHVRFDAARWSMRRPDSSTSCRKLRKKIDVGVRTNEDVRSELPSPSRCAEG